MNEQQEQLVKLLVSSSQPAWEIEAIHKRCCIYFGIEKAFWVCQEIMEFAREANLSLLESFRLQVEVTEISSDRPDW